MTSLYDQNYKNGVYTQVTHIQKPTNYVAMYTIRPQ